MKFSKYLIFKIFFILVRNALKRKLDLIVEEENRKKSDKLD